MESVREKIEKRAYELFLARGGQDGYHIQDWAKAEKEISAEMAAKEKPVAPKEKPIQKVETEKPAPKVEPEKPKKQAAATTPVAKKKVAKKKAS